ncbi:MAG TPA: transglutaminase domain-containing protein [Solirubrobacteraceae bacterium]|nr:transglutaminase domain-containing protein [Solirubrobacteraceae bacterium]
MPTAEPPAPPRAPHRPPRPSPRPPAPAGGHAPLLPAHIARAIGFAALAGFAALQWAGMVQPAAADALLGSVLAATVTGLGLAVLARRGAPARVRVVATVLAAAAVLLVALAASGAPGRMLAPRGWDELADGIAQGLGAVSTVRTPYAGVDEWTRLVLILGGCALAGLAGLLAFMPRRGGAFGSPAAAAAALGALYTVPVMQHDIDLPWVAGLAFTLLLAAFLWLERVERRAAGPAAALVALAALGGYAAAPKLDGDRALLDYEEIAQSLSPTATTQYSWNHDYGPLDWPRDGREILRVRARQRSYWKAVNLTAFDGVRWVQNPVQGANRHETEVFDRRWRHTLQVTMRALRSTQFVAAGTTLDILDSPRSATSNAPGVYETVGSPLRRGHAYRAEVYTPRPSTAQLRAAPAAVPLDLPREYAVVRLPGLGPRGRLSVVFPWWTESGPPVVAGADWVDAREALAESSYGKVYELARRLRARAATPYGFVRAVERHLRRGFTYSEAPPRRRVPLAAFLLRDRVGYCQQFSGAMALLLRMGGLAARVASGFSPGSLDAERREYVVRDVDAHSWVEVYMPGIGWVTRDPTPPDAPARTQLADAAEGAGREPVSFAGSERALDRPGDVAGGGAAGTGGDEGGGPPPALVLGGGAAALALAAGAALLVRRRRRAARAASEPGADEDVAELLRALCRSGRPPPPRLTLAELAERYAGTAAQGYVRALAAARYGYGGRRPSRAERVALRRELGAGLGPHGRLRAWWALPPKRPRSPRR